MKRLPVVRLVQDIEFYHELKFLLRNFLFLMTFKCLGKGFPHFPHSQIFSG